MKAKRQEKPSKEDIEKALDLIRAEKNRIIVERWFKEYCNQTDLFEWEDNKRFNEYKKSYDIINVKHKYEKKIGKKKTFMKRGNSNKISDAYKLFMKCGFLDKKSIEQERLNGIWEISKYRLNMNFYFEYIKRSRRIDLPQQWREFLIKEIDDYRNPFELPITDSKQDLFEYIDYIIKKFILFQRFKIIRPEDIQKGILHVNSDFIIALRLSLTLFDDLTRDIFSELIRGKLINLKTDSRDEISPENLKRIDQLLMKI